MTLFYLLAGLMLAGFGAIAFIMATEKKKESPSPAPELSKKPTDQPQLSPKDLLGRLGLENPKDAKLPTAQPQQPLPPLFQNPAKPAAPDTKAESELSLKYDELLSQHHELEEKFNKLESLFSEKSSSLDKSEKTLNNELKNQKDFNKVKDLLEKELREAKDKTKNLQADVATAQTETQTHLKRVEQLEEKVKKLEVEILTSEAAINDGQAGVQLARKHAAELEEKLRNNENVIFEKNKKIEDLVSRLNIPPATNALPAEPQPAAAETYEPAPAPEPEPASVPTPEPPPPAAEVPPTPTPEPEQPAAPIESPPEPAAPAPNVVEKEGGPAPESLSLPPDIFAKPKEEEEPPPPKQQGETP